MVFCFKTVKFSILVNGESLGVFLMEWGTRQGDDPLSPFLFILVMEGLNNNRWSRGFEVSSRAGVSIEICQLPYADDILLFCEAKDELIRYIRSLAV